MRKEGMKFMGTLFGCDLWLETDDEDVSKLAEKHLQTLSKRNKTLSEIELENELELFCRRK